MSRRFIAMIPVGVLVLIAGGCSVNTDLGGTKIPNSRPDTRVTGQPPTLLEAGFAVQFNWTGSDPDGRVVGYRWKISDNGVDGISPADTLTIDPLTGAELHPWHFTSANDTIFLVLADQPDFPGDETGQPRSYRSHSLFIAAVDDQGAIDPSPALISFTSTTIVPRAKAEYPNLGNQGFKLVPPTVNMGWSGTDSDFDLRTPTKSRWLWKRAVDDGGNPIRTPFEYSLHYDEIINFDDPEWSPWVPYANLDVDRQVAFPNELENEYFLFAVQVQDTAGAVSVGLGYQVEVAHVKVLADFFQPAVQLNELFLGPTVSLNEESEIAGGQPLNFGWTASAADYNGKIVSYRHGWDLVSVDDPNDPGWAVPPGLSEQNLFATERSFEEGVHTFTLRVEDDSQQTRIVNWVLRVVPFVAPEFQQPLLVLDQVGDHNVGNWPDQSGRPRNDEAFRNAWWHFLADGAGGVTDISWERDWREHTADVKYSDIVGYKVVLCYAESNDFAQRMFRDFRPIGNADKFVWLTPYQQRGGNMFLVGQSSMESFLEGLSNYMVPMIFNTREENFSIDGRVFLVGFGTKELPDGTEIQRGPLMYPYATAGIAALDWTSPNSKTIYNRTEVVRFDRTADCNGLKGLVLDDDFRSYHGVGPGVIADTIWTNPEIDWHDYVDAGADTMRLFHNSFPFRRDEFVDGNASTRSTPLLPQECEDGPNGMCIQPMFRGIARFDFIREYRWARGETDWPFSRYNEIELEDGCGPMGLTSYQGVAQSSARTNGRTFGYFSYKVVQDKPTQKADVYWGFDPYRFDQEESRKAIRWVLQYFGLGINQ